MVYTPKNRRSLCLQIKYHQRILPLLQPASRYKEASLWTRAPGAAEGDSVNPGKALLDGSGIEKSILGRRWSGQRGTKKARAGAHRFPEVKRLGVIHRKGEDGPSGEPLAGELDAVEDTFALVAQHNIVVNAPCIFDRDGEFAALAGCRKIERCLVELWSTPPTKTRSR